MPWDWVTFPELLDSTERTPKSVNILPYAPAGPMLVWVQLPKNQVCLDHTLELAAEKMGKHPVDVMLAMDVEENLEREKRSKAGVRKRRSLRNEIVSAKSGDPGRQSDLAAMATGGNLAPRAAARANELGHGNASSRTTGSD